MFYGGYYAEAAKLVKQMRDAGVTATFVSGDGPLDQGWWPDGLYAAPTDQALRYDIEVLKKLGCNMMRKHVKVEPARFYFHVAERAPTQVVR